MNLRTFALTLGVTLVLASVAGATEHKRHPQAEDRHVSALSDSQYWQMDRSQRRGALDPLNRDPLTSANGS